MLYTKKLLQNYKIVVIKRSKIKTDKIEFLQVLNVKIFIARTFILTMKKEIRQLKFDFHYYLLYSYNSDTGKKQESNSDILQDCGKNTNLQKTIQQNVNRKYRYLDVPRYMIM